jgi:O-antigen/teichoic acid export membrane protein
MTGAMITLGGAIITVALNIFLIPKYHYLGAAIATFCCYLFMMIISYVLGQKYYPVPYARKKLISYLVLVVLIYLIHRGLLLLYDNIWFSISSATLLLALFAVFVSKIERKDLERLPVIGKYFVPKPI